MSGKNFKPEIPVIGDLETAILDQLWSIGSASVKSVHAALPSPHGDSSCNTVQSAMDRLFRKALLSRQKQGHAFIYSPAISRESLVASMMSHLIERFGSDPATSLCAFVDSNDEVDETTLQALQQLIAVRRQRDETE